MLVTNLFVLYTYYWFSIKYTPKPVVTFALLLLCASFFPVRMELAVTVLMWTIPSLVLAALGMMMFPIFTVYVTSLVQQANKRKEEYYQSQQSEPADTK